MTKTKNKKKKKQLNGYYIDGAGKIFKMYEDEDSCITRTVMKSKNDKKNNDNDTSNGNR